MISDALDDCALMLNTNSFKLSEFSERFLSSFRQLQKKLTAFSIAPQPQNNNNNEEGSEKEKEREGEAANPEWIPENISSQRGRGRGRGDRGRGGRRGRRRRPNRQQHRQQQEIKVAEQEDMFRLKKLFFSL